MVDNFRPAGAGDIEILLPLMRQLFEHDGVPFSEAVARRAALQLIEEPRAGQIWLIESDRRPIGYVVLTIGFSLEFGGWHGFIDELFIEAGHRGSGLGTAAIRHLQAECARQGMTALLLEADLDNEGATRLYRRLGFQEHPRRLMMLTVSPPPAAPEPSVLDG